MTADPETVFDLVNMADSNMFESLNDDVAR
jgi:hypothetical protein